MLSRIKLEQGVDKMSQAFKFSNYPWKKILSYLSNNVLNQLVHSKCNISMHTKHLPTCIFKVCGIHITCNKSQYIFLCKQYRYSI